MNIRKKGIVGDPLDETQYKTLKFLEKHPQRPINVAQHFVVDNVAAFKRLESLKRKGLVDKKFVRHKLTIYFLTEKGKELVKKTFSLIAPKPTVT